MRNIRLSHPFPIEKALLVLSILCFAASADIHAQEVPRPSLARQVTQTVLPTIYNVKAGPVLFRVGATLRTEYIDNVNLGNGTTTPAEPDLVINPILGIDALWTVSALNTLHLHTEIGYTKYLNHPELDSSSLLVSPDSVLSFNIYVGDFKINLHEQFSYQEDPVSQGTIANVEKFDRISNDAGLEVLWDLNDVIATLGYDHSNFITTGAIASNGASLNVSALNYTTDEITSSVFFQILSNLGGGIEGTASSTNYASETAADADRISFGPFLEFQLSRYTKIAASGGYQGTFFTNSGGLTSTDSTGGLAASNNGSSKGNSYYANLTISNRLNRFITNQISVGHEDEVGILSADTQTTYLRISSNIQIAPRMALGAEFGYADTDDSGAFSSVLGNTAANHYQLITLTLSTGYQITRKLNASLQYQFTDRTGGGGNLNQNYRQNRIALVLGYQF